MRTLAILVVLISAPASLGVIGWGLVLIWKTAGIAAFLLSCLVVAIAGLGVASLLEDHRPQPNFRPDDR